MTRNTTDKPTRRPHQHLISTTATETKCHACNRVILNGYEEGLLVRVDPTPVTRTDADLAPEVQAMLAGRDTYVLTAGRDLVQRTADRIASAHPTGTIHQVHRCNIAVQPDLWSAA